MHVIKRTAAAVLTIALLSACSSEITPVNDIAPADDQADTTSATEPDTATDDDADTSSDTADESETTEPDAAAAGDDEDVQAAANGDGTFPLFAANGDYESDGLFDHSFRAPLDAYDFEATAANADVAGECYAQMVVTGGDDINIEWQADTEAAYGPNAFASEFNGMDGIGASYSLVTNDRRDDEPVPTYAKFEAQVVPNGDTAARVSIFLDPENPYVGDSYAADDSGNYAGVTELAFARNVTGGVIDAELLRVTESGGDAYPETVHVKGYFTCDAS